MIDRYTISLYQMTYLISIMVEKTHTYPSGSQHVGEMKDDQATVTGGKGIHVFGYVGEWKDGKKNGQGTYTYSNGGQYVGEYKDNMQHGQGTQTFSNGGQYVGEWKEDKFHGQGTYTYSNGGQYVGEYEKDKRHGQGAYTKSNGDKYVGEWRNDDFLG